MINVKTNVNQIDFSLNDIPTMPHPTGTLMVDPAHFSVDYVINPHMADYVGSVDKEQAREQWQQIKEIFQRIGLDVYSIDGQEGLPDMVFCANQSLPYIDADGEKHTIMSIMHADERKQEVPHIQEWFQEAGYTIHQLDQTKIDNFEGCGDAIWHTGKRMLWGGYGYRSSLQAYERVADTFDVPVIALELVDEAFYHLDTCFCVLDQESVLIYPDAFTAEGLELIRAIFTNVVEASEHEAKKRFACNATCPDGQNVIIQEGSSQVNAELRDAGFTVHEVDTSEFIKSGGSVFCMKQMVW